MAVNQTVIERIQRLKSLEVAVRAGRAVRRYKLVKSSGPDDLVFQSVRTGAPMRDNNILVRHIKPAAAKLGHPLGQLAGAAAFVCDVAKMAGADVKDAQALMRHIGPARRWIYTRSLCLSRSEGGG